jgi:pimeloyl-ACP methyl ester carboxylesterase
MRAIDYLETRPEIDARRIGCTGCSGGGTETSYLMALDERVVCAAPACYITTFRRLIDTIGPQDAEQNIFGQVAFGMDQPDYLLMRAAKPTLICATTEDFFDIGGSWDALRQSKRVYARLGFPQHVDLVEAEGKHGLGPVGRKAMVEWMRRWLLGVDDSITEAEMSLRSEQELHCTPRGQVLLLPQEKSVFDLNRERAQPLSEARGQWRAKASADEQRRKIREMIGASLPDELPQARPRVVGTVERDGYRIEKVVLETGADVSLPALLFVPAKPSVAPVLYLHGEGKQVDAAPAGPIEQLVKQGSLVLAVDLRGLGETAPGPKNELLGAAWKEFYLAYLLGQSMVGLRTDDVLAAARYLAEFESNGRPQQVRLIGIGEAAVPALHAVALKPQRFAAVRLDAPLPSWTESLSTSEPAGQLIHAVHGVLGVYDLPDLVSLCELAKVAIEPAPRPVE